MIKVLRGSTQGLDLSKDKKLSLNVNPIGFKSISSDELVVGDLVLIEAGMKVPCDIILLTSSVLINEGSITGESYPMTKTSITYSDTVYNP
jgi:P-type E1-E2 ATPase